MPGSPVPRRHDLFVSLKMYFGHAQTLDWSREIARIVSHSARNEPRFTPRVALFPSFTSLESVRRIVGSSGVNIGAQDVAADEVGAQTGEISAAELSEIGCDFVEIGHAERRALFGETNETIASKVINVVSRGITPLICVGEIENEDSARAADVAVEQLQMALRLLVENGVSTSIVIAYEPVWAIGQATAASVDHVAVVIEALRDAARHHVAVTDSSVIYGGSAGPDTAPQMLNVADGLFLGRFAHDPRGFEEVLDVMRDMLMGQPQDSGR